MDMDQYLDVFIDESKEHLQSCSEKLLELEKNPGSLEIVNEIFRSAHTLKGMAATMGFEDLASLTHTMENVLDGIRGERIAASQEAMDAIFSAMDDLEAMIESISSGGDGKRDVTVSVAQLVKIEKGEESVQNTVLAETAASIAVPSPHGLDMDYGPFDLAMIEQSREMGYGCYEISIALRHDCLLKTARVYMVFEVLEKFGEVIKSEPAVEKLEKEEFDSSFTVALVTNQDIQEIRNQIMLVSEIEKVDVRDIAGKSAEVIQSGEPGNVQTADHKSPESSAQQASPKGEQKQGNKTIRVNIDRLNLLMNLFEELVIDKGRLEQISRDAQNTELTETVERLSRVSGDLQEVILKMRMMPVETVFNRFPRMVRQLAKDLNKNMKLEIVGAETELDRTVLDEIGDPIVHLLRNAIDHGIEKPSDRKAAGKPEEGTIILRAFHSGNHVYIEIQDDGGGINRERVIKKALSNGIISANDAERLTDQQASELIMAPGFSTAETISDISGRGVGLDVVRSAIESLGGSITIHSTEGKGSLFSIQLPLTLSIITALLIKAGGETYAIPLTSIVETAIIREDEIMTAHTKKVVDYRGSIIPIVNLGEVFQAGDSIEESGEIPLVIVRKGDKRAALAVDAFIGQHEIVMKSLGDYLTKVFAISGGAILGDGQVALIIDCNSLIQ